MLVKTESKKRQKNGKAVPTAKRSESNVDISMTQAARKGLAECLSLVLADTYTLYLKTQNFHWNVKGARFTALHQLFETQYRELFEAVDVIAERIRALGFLAPGSFTEFLKMTMIEEGNGTLPASEMIRALMNDNEKLSQSIHTFVAKAEAAVDQATLDLFSQRMAAHEKAAWMLRSTLED